MKKINLLSFFVIGLLVTFSCTNEKPENSTESSVFRMIDNDLKKAKSEFLAIMSSTAWINHEKAAKDFASMLNGTAIDLSTLKKRDTFNTFITANLSKTKWTDISSAMNQFDQMNELGNILNNEMASFMLSLRNADQSDIKEIFAPAFVIPQLTAYSPCEEGCNLAYTILCNRAYNMCVQEVCAAILDGGGNIQSIRDYWSCMEAEASATNAACLADCNG